MASTISFNSYNLQTSNIITGKISHNSSPESNVILEQKSRFEGSLLMSNYWTRKVITVNGTIIGSSVSNLESRIDTLKQNLVGENLNLDIGYAGGTRRYIATISRVNIEREHFNSSWCPFSLEFICANPFGKNTTAVTETHLGNVGNPFSDTFTIAGSIGPYPVITLDFKSGNSVTAVKVENTTTSSFMTVTRSFATAEILEIDCENLTVEVDSSGVDFSGVFPSFAIGSNKLQVTVTGSPFEIDMTTVYNSLYI